MTFYKLFFHSFCVIFWSTLVLSKPIWNQELIKSRGYVPKTNTFDFTLKRATLAPDGFTRSLATFNGQYPGPTIEVNKGDSIAMKVLNELGEPTAIHSHGIFQRGTPWFDGVPGQSQCLIPNNFTFTYEFAVPDQAGTYWYHSHAMTQYVDGAVGALIIHDPDDPYLKEYDEEIIVMLTDYYHTEAETLLKDYLSPSSKGVVPVPDNGLINGKSNFDCSKAPQGSKCVDNADLAKFEFVSNKRYRLRIINTSAFSSFFFSIDKHEMEVIEVEGSYTKRNKIHRLPINVAQRYSVIVTANQPVDNYIMRSEFQKTCMPDGAKDLPIIKAIVHYDGAPEQPAPKDAPWSDVLDECVDLNQGTLQPLNEETPPQSTKELDVEIELDVNPTTGIVEASIDGSSYVPDIPSPSLSKIFAGDLNFPKERNAYIFDKPGEVVDISFINGDIGEHPFHMHGHQFWVLGFGKGIVDKSKLNTVNPIKRDTSAVPASGWSVIRFIPDNPGAFGLHCHMEWHLQAGLLMQLIEFPEKVKAMSPPQAWVDLCKMNTKY